MKNIIAILLTALAIGAGFAHATDAIDVKNPILEDYPVIQDELQIDGFASYNFSGDAEPWGAGVGATFFPGGGNIGFNIDYSVIPNAGASDAQLVNVGATYRLNLTDDLDAYVTGIAGYLVNDFSLDQFGRTDFGDSFQYGGRAGIRYAPLPNTPIAVFADFGRTWVDSGDGYNSARAGLTVFF